MDPYKNVSCRKCGDVEEREVQECSGKEYDRLRWAAVALRVEPEMCEELLAVLLTLSQGYYDDMGFQKQGWSVAA